MEVIICDICEGPIDGVKGVGIVLQGDVWEMNVCGNCLAGMGSDNNVRNIEECSSGKSGILEDGSKT
jgi:hypothetical protein